MSDPNHKAIANNNARVIEDFQEVLQLRNERIKELEALIAESYKHIDYHVCCEIGGSDENIMKAYYILGEEINKEDN